MKRIAALFAAAAALGLAPRHAAAQSLVNCESVNGDRQVCRVDTRGGVSIRRQLSSTRCVEGRNWGYSRSAIWVSNGCRAQFVVNPTGRYGSVYNNNGSNTNRDVSSAETLCRRAVREQLGRRANVSTWMINNSRNNPRVGWRIANGRSGECRLDRNGNVSVLANRNR
jgi:hypothetical protein